MVFEIKHFVQALVWVAPLATGLTIAASPTIAVSSAKSAAKITFSDFSHSPTSVATDTDTDSVAIANDGAATADSKAEANFAVAPPAATNSLDNVVTGEGTSYFSAANSNALVVGEFFVNAGESFSFNFAGSLDLLTQIDAPDQGNAGVAIVFNLFDSTDASQPILLDAFSLFGNLSTPDDRDSFELESTSSISFDPNQTSLTTQLGGLNESAKATIAGTFNRLFASNTQLTLVEAKAGGARVAPVPEPSEWLAALFGIGAVVVLKRRFSRQAS